MGELLGAGDVKISAGGKIRNESVDEKGNRCVQDNSC